MKYAKRITAAVTALAVSLALYATTYAESTGGQALMHSRSKSRYNRK